MNLPGTSIHPQLPIVLNQFVEGIQAILKNNFIGAYLVGSMATGDFDQESDIDFLVIINEELSSTEVEALTNLHETIFALNCYPAKHLEGSYMTRSILQDNALVGKKPLWYLDNGSTTLERSIHDNQWHVLWCLRECAIILQGEDPKKLMDPIPWDALGSELKNALNNLKNYFSHDILEPLSFFNSRFGQSFTVLTCCRALHTLQSGKVQSKRTAVEWAMQALDTTWHPLIQEAWKERVGAGLGHKIKQKADAEILQATLDFLVYAREIACEISA